MAQTMNTGLADVAVHYLHFLQAKVTPATVQKDLEENAWYPSLLSLSDTFSKYKIHNDAFEVDEANFEMLEVPFAAYIFVPGTGIREKRRLLHPQRRKHCHVQIHQYR